jgi:hypothetical protein
MDEGRKRVLLIAAAILARESCRTSMAGRGSPRPWRQFLMLCGGPRNC